MTTASRVTEMAAKLRAERFTERIAELDKTAARKRKSDAQRLRRQGKKLAAEFEQNTQEKT